MFSNKNKATDVEQKIKIFKQGRKHITDFIIKFEVLAIKDNINELHTIFLLKKNVWADIIKTILEYLPIAVSEILKEQKIVITLVGQEYKSTESWQEYKTGIETTYRGKGIPMDIGNSRNNFKDRKLKYFNYNIQSHMAKKC